MGVVTCDMCNKRKTEGLTAENNEGLGFKTLKQVGMKEVSKKVGC